MYENSSVNGVAEQYIQIAGTIVHFKHSNLLISNVFTYLVHRLKSFLAGNNVILNKILL